MMTRFSVFVLLFALSLPVRVAGQEMTLTLDENHSFSDIAAVNEDALTALLGDHPDILGGYLGVQDTKDIQGQPRPNSGLGVIIASASTGPRYEEVNIVWPDGQPASDLEAICSIPGRSDEFFVAESGYFQGRYGRVMHVKLARTSSEWSASILGTTKLPKGTTGIEGIACAAEGNRVVLALGERGGPHGAINGRIVWNVVTLGALPEKLTLKSISYDSPAALRLDRDITAMYRDTNGLLWIASAQDLGDYGPFRSSVQLAGRLSFSTDSPIKLHEVPVIVYYSRSAKIEGIAAGMLPGSALSVTTENEALGGHWFPLDRTASIPP